MVVARSPGKLLRVHRRILQHKVANALVDRRGVEAQQFAQSSPAHTSFMPRAGDVVKLQFIEHEGCRKTIHVQNEIGQLGIQTVALAIRTAPLRLRATGATRVKVVATERNK